MAESVRETAATIRILDGAVKWVRTKGCASTTIDELCREAHVSKGQISTKLRIRKTSRSPQPTVL